MHACVSVVCVCVCVGGDEDDEKEATFSINTVKLSLAHDV